MYKLLCVLVLVCSIRAAGCEVGEKCCPIGVNNACYEGDLINVFTTVGGHEHLTLTLLVRIFTYCDSRPDKCYQLVYNISDFCGQDSASASTCKKWFENDNKAIKQGILNRLPVVAQQMTDLCIDDGGSACFDLAEKLVQACSQIDGDSGYPLASVCPIFFKSSATVEVPVCGNGVITGTVCNCEGSSRTNGYCVSNVYFPSCDVLATNPCYCADYDRVCDAGEVCSTTCKPPTVTGFPGYCDADDAITTPCYCGGGTLRSNGYCSGIGAAGIYPDICGEGEDPLVGTCWCLGGGIPGLCAAGSTCGASSSTSCSASGATYSGVCPASSQITSTCNCGGTLYSSGYCNNTVTRTRLYMNLCSPSNAVLNATCYCGVGTVGKKICAKGDKCTAASGCNETSTTAFPPTCTAANANPITTIGCFCAGILRSDGYCNVTAPARYIAQCKAGVVADTCYCGVAGSGAICPKGERCVTGSSCSYAGTAAFPPTCTAANANPITTGCFCAGILRSNGYCNVTAPARYLPPCVVGTSLPDTCYCTTGTVAKICPNGAVCKAGANANGGCNESAVAFPGTCIADTEITRSCFCGTELVSGPNKFCTKVNSVDTYVLGCPVDVALTEGCYCVEGTSSTCGVGDKCVTGEGCKKSETVTFVVNGGIASVIAYCGLGGGDADDCDTFLNKLLSIPNPNQKILQAIETIATNSTFVANIANAADVVATANKLLSVCVTTKTPGICAGYFANAEVVNGLTTGSINGDLLENLLEFVAHFPVSRFAGSAPAKSVLTTILSSPGVTTVIQSEPVRYLDGLFGTCYQDKDSKSCSVLTSAAYGTTEIGLVRNECSEKGLDYISETVGIVSVCATHGISNPVCQNFSDIFVGSDSLEVLAENCGSGPAQADWKTEDFAVNLECRAAQKALLRVCDGNYNAICRSIHEVIWEIEKVIAPLPPSFLVNTFHWFWNLVFE